MANELGRLTGGCNLDRSIDGLIREAGFEICQLEQSYAKGLKPFSYIYSGYTRSLSDLAPTNS